jgi:alkylation response protein AidB-like acyl-CoA dehydrogenase
MRLPCNNNYGKARMDFNLTEEQIAFQTLARNFAQQEIEPFAKTWDEKEIFPFETFRKAAALGLSGIYVKTDQGGSGLSRLDGALIFEELARACPPTAAYLSVHNMVAWIIAHYGTAEQRQIFLPKLLTMESFASYCLTEPDAGSDAASLKTTAVKDGDDYILNGSKSFISGGSLSDIYLCMVRTGEEGSKGISCLAVEKSTPGLSFGKKEHKLGWHSVPITMVFFENCRVSVRNQIGESGAGFKIALSALNGGRINIAACSLGGAGYCLEKAQAYMRERHQFNEPLTHFQALQFKIADMATNLEASRLMTYRAADALERQRPDAPLLCAMAKQFATEKSFEICNQALQILGGYGYLREYSIERYFRDLRVHQILEGTNEIMRMAIARKVLDL